MRKNLLRQQWLDGQSVVNAWLCIGSAFPAELVAAQGYDTVTIDTQHGVMTSADVVPMLQALQGQPVTPLVRVPWLEPGAIMRALDAGARGVICPMINNAEEAAEFASYMRYPPQGLRSYGPARAATALGADYFTQANNDVLCIAMIETAEAFENLEAIVATPGLDAVYVGPADLTLSLSNGKLPPGTDHEEPEIVEAIMRILEVSHAHNVKACLHCYAPAYAAKAVQWGFDMVTLSSDIGHLASRTAELVDATRTLIENNATNS